MKRLGRFFLRLVLPLLVFLLGPVGCGEKIGSVIPDMPVYIRINIANFTELSVPTGSYYFANQGYGGVIVVRDIDDSFAAYDASCPYEVSQSTIVSASGGSAVCPVCGSKFLLIQGGQLLQGPAKQMLRPYKTSFNPATGDLTVVN
jgi:nitrite reductase/ring-hydroxylating ferredoxin subunit